MKHIRTQLFFITLLLSPYKAHADTDEHTSKLPSSFQADMSDETYKKIEAILNKANTMRSETIKDLQEALHYTHQDMRELLIYANNATDKKLDHIEKIIVASLTCVATGTYLATDKTSEKTIKIPVAALITIATPLVYKAARWMFSQMQRQSSAPAEKKGE